MTSFDQFVRATIRLPRATIQFVENAAAQAAVGACDDLGVKRLLVVGTGNAQARYAHVWQALTSITAASFFEAEPHCPAAVVDSCVDTYRNNNCDGVLVIGGGSTIGLGKFLSARHDARFIAIPTTYSGSETTPIYGRKIGNEKRTKVDDACRPEIVIYDPGLSKDLPMGFTVTSAFNSIAHAAEALYPGAPQPIAAALAKECLEAHKNGLELLAAGTNQIEARRLLLYGGCLGGLVIGMTGIALHHQLCHVIGGLFDLPHSESNCVVLPQALDYNREYIEDADRAIAQIIGGSSGARATFDLAARFDAPQSLGALGMPEDGVDAVVETMLQHAGYNPRPLEEAGLRRTVQNAYEGNRPN